jgi:hypothetical protein
VAAVGVYANPESLYVSLWKQTYPAGYTDFKPVQERNVKVAGTDAYELVFTFRSLDIPTAKVKQVVLLRGQKYYEISYLSSEKDYDRFLPDADRAIDSFRFVEKLTVDAQPRIASVTVDQTTYSAEDLPKVVELAEGTHTISVTSPIPESGFMGILGARIMFDRWSGDLSGSTPTATIKMDGPKTVTAEWRTDYTMPYAIIGVTGAVIIVVALLLLMKRRRAPVPAPAYQPPPVPTAAPTPLWPISPVAPAPAGKFCINCGEPMSSDAVFCRMCGKKQEHALG